MASRQEPIYTPAEYLAFERAAETKHEYLNGRIYAMSGTKRNHVRVTTNVLISLGTQLRHRPCEVFNSDMRVRVSATGLYTYPDVSALCGEPRFEDDEVDVLLNPNVIVEVLSPSTAAYDRGDKFEHYRKIPTLQEYLLFEQNRAHAERYARTADDRWVLTEADGLDAVLALSGIDCTLAMREVYERVEFPPDRPLRAVYEDAPPVAYALNRT